MRMMHFLAAPAAAALVIACAHRDTNAPPQTETTGAPVEQQPQQPSYKYYKSTAPRRAPGPESTIPGTDMQQNTTGTDQSPGSETWGTIGPSGTGAGAGPRYGARDGGS